MKTYHTRLGDKGYDDDGFVSSNAAVDDLYLCPCR